MQLTPLSHISTDQPALAVAGARGWQGYGYWYWFSAGAPGGRIDKI